MGVQLVHSTAYYPQGNGLAESSNKSLVKIIKKLLEQNTRGWDSKLKFALWADRVTNKKSIGTSPFKLVYGTEAIFHVQLALPVAKVLQETDSKPSDLTRRIHNLVELQQDREQLMEKTELHQEKMKEIFDMLAPKMNQSLWFHFVDDSMVICSFLHLFLISSSVKT
jgi:hypothetical protein